MKSGDSDPAARRGRAVEAAEDQKMYFVELPGRPSGVGMNGGFGFHLVAWR